MRLKLALSFMLVELAFILIGVLFNHFWRERPLPLLVVEICLYVLVGLSAPILFSQYFTRNIRELAELAGVISGGDLTQKVNVRSADEVGELARSFNAMLSSMLNIVTEVKTNSEEIFRLAQTLSGTSEEMNASTEEISSTIQNIARGAEVQADMVNRTSEITRRLAEQVEDISKRALRADELASQARIKAEQGEEHARSAVAQINDVAAKVERAGKAVRQFQANALDINKTVDFITSVAQQTHLLALNASIEAARAGEQGRGFAVVAEEVRKLAQNARRFAQQISGLADAINEGSSEVIQSMGETSMAGKAGVSAVQLAGNSLEDISDAVLASAERMKEISSLTAEQARGADGLVKAFEELHKIAESNAAGTQQASAATQEQTASMEEMAASAQQLARTSDTLKDLVSIFKVES
jgi:methyl-accepting chemotaxis protein